MAIAKDELQEIIAREMPGFKIAERIEGEDHVTPETDNSSADISTLRKKYLGQDSQELPPPVDSGDEIIVVEPIEVTDSFRSGARAKTVVVSGTEKHIIGEQG